jgi:hypothetical protein
MKNLKYIYDRLVNSPTAVTGDKVVQKFLWNAVNASIPDCRIIINRLDYSICDDPSVCSVLSGERIYYHVGQGLMYCQMLLCGYKFPIMPEFESTNRKVDYLNAVDMKIHTPGSVESIMKQ